MLVVKLSHKQDIRRITVEGNISLGELTKLANSLFGKELPQSFLFKYKDDDLDEITVTSDRELQEAFRLFGSQGALRFSIVAAKEDEVVPQKPSPPVQEPETVPIVPPPQINNEEKEEESNSDDTPVENDEKKEETTTLEMRIFPFLKEIEKGFQEFFPKIEKAFEEMLPKLGEHLPNLEEVFPKIEKKLMETFVTQRKFESPAATPDQPKEEEVPKEEPKEEIKPEPKLEESESKPEVVFQNPEVPQPKQESSPFESKLAQLEEMGFDNRFRNIELLMKRKGDMILVVKDLLE